MKAEIPFQACNAVPLDLILNSAVMFTGTPWDSDRPWPTSESIITLGPKALWNP